MIWTIFVMIFILVIILIMINNRTKGVFKSIKIKPIPYTFYWINLDKAKDRKIKMLEMFKQHNIKNRRIEAILGGPNKIDKEIACTSSHIKAIQTFYES